jgi:hypothetical protein
VTQEGRLLEAAIKQSTQKSGPQAPADEADAEPATDEFEVRCSLQLRYERQGLVRDVSKAGAACPLLSPRS